MSTRADVVKLRATRAVWLLIGRYGLGVGLNLAGSIILARRLGPEVWGLYAVSLFVLMAFQELLGKGIAVYFIQKPDQPDRAEIETASTIQHLLGFLAALGVIFAAPHVSQRHGYAGLAPLLVGAAVGGYFYGLRSIPMALLERNFAYAKVALVELLDTLTFYACAIAAVLLGAGTAGMAVGNALRGAVTALASHLFARQRPSFSWRGSVARTLLAFGLPSLGASLLNVSIAAAPPALLGGLVGSEALGLVQMGFSILGYVLIPVGIIARVSLSAYARIQSNPAALNEALRKTVLLVLFAIAPLLVVVSGFSPKWSAVYGVRWVPIAYVMAVASPGFLIGGTFWPLSSALYAAGAPRAVFWFLLAFSAVYWGGSLLLIRPMGYLGLPLAWSMAHLMTYPIIVYSGHRLFGRLDYSVIGVALGIAAVAMGATWTLARHPGTGAAAVAVAVIFIGGWLVVFRQPWRWLRAAVSGLQSIGRA